MSSSSSPSHSTSPPPQHPHQPPKLLTRQIRSDFDLEPNPFEQSFSARPSSNVRNTASHSPPSVDSNNDSDNHRSRSPPSEPNQPNRSASPRPVLPPLAAISSPADTSYPWPFPSNSLGNSLRSGPLSPAMLAGPQQQNADSHLQFDPASLRTGLTPRTGMTPRTGLTPATGLTPLVGAGNAPFPPSPNTAALISLINAGSSSAAQNSSLTITPNTLNAISGALNTVPSQHHYQPSHLHNSHTLNNAQEEEESAYTADAPTATSTEAAANGLFLLSQAHQELTKREAQARAGVNGSRAAPSTRSTNGAVNGASKRNAKRKSYDVTASSPPPASQPRVGKRTRASASSHSRRRSLTEDMEGEDEEDEDDGMSIPGDGPPDGTTNSGRKSNKKPETEEEKRKNFLERNRQAALKCRQRKKAWLASLQAKVEYLTNENDRLTSALVSSREEIARLSAMVGGASVGPGVPVPMGVHVGGGGRDTGGGGIGVGMQGKQSVSVGGASGRGGYGY